METHRNREAEDEVRGLLDDAGLSPTDVDVAVTALKEAGFVFRVDTGHGHLAEMGVLVHRPAIFPGDPPGRPYHRLVMQQAWREGEWPALPEGDEKWLAQLEGER